MVFVNEKKKELWRYASRNNPASCDGIHNQPPQPPHPLHLHHPQTTDSPHPYFASTCFTAESSRQRPTPPPSYSSIPCAIDCSSSFPPHSQFHHQDMDLHTLTSTTGESDITCEEPDDYSKGRISCASSGDLLRIPPRFSENSCQTPLFQLQPTATQTPISPTPLTSATTLAINMFRKCCGGCGQVTETSEPRLGYGGSSPASKRQSYSRHYHQRSIKPSLSTCQLQPQRASSNMLRIPPTRTPIEDFNALTKQLKKKQMAELLGAVKSRVEPPSTAKSLCPAALPSAPSYLQCILIKRSLSIDEEQYVTTCRLFFWPDLRNTFELKRLPTCPSATDFVYVCCNPLHWYRVICVIDPESAPPSYQRSIMLRLRDADSEENFQNIEKSATVWSTENDSHSITSIIKRAESELYVQSLESFTTDGEDRTSFSKVWCSIAYWELGKRVGEFFHAKKLAVNIHTNGYSDNLGDSMCLRDLVAQRPGNDAVQNTRQKIGLGVTLNLDCDGVWIYNRGNVSIFVDSPTLSERLDRVCKVMPGCCLKAFDTHRAQKLASKQSRNRNLGPIDCFSMKISFAKGWGPTYRRQNIMCCPCWVEVHFSQLR